MLICSEGELTYYCVDLSKKRHKQLIVIVTDKSEGIFLFYFVARCI
jgi:hypothetical protein